jgi:hypothetical protein
MDQIRAFLINRLEGKYQNVLEKRLFIAVFASARNWTAPHSHNNSIHLSGDSF